MSKLIVKADKGHGRVAHVTPESAGWTYVGFDLHRLKPGETASARTGGREVCLVFVTGKGKVDRRRQGSRPARRAHVALRGQALVGLRAGEIRLVASPPTPISNSPSAPRPASAAACRVRVIAPESLGQEVRGKGTNTRHVTNILPENEPADSLLVVEVITPGGNTSSYPPHKHDQDNLPAESYLEETYYHRLNPPQGFAFQRVYTDDRSLDEAMAIEDGDVVLVPRGYHPCATCHGYDLYYLNVMAGPKRTWKFHNAAEHEWLMKA